MHKVTNKHMIDKSPASLKRRGYTSIQRVLRAPAVFVASLPELSSKFSESHTVYCNWLKQGLYDLFECEIDTNAADKPVKVNDLIRGFGIDRYTIHYRTVHPKGGLDTRDWLQVSRPPNPEKDLNLEGLSPYDDEESPYISFAAERKEDRGKPILIRFNEKDKSQLSGPWVEIGNKLSAYLTQITHSSTKQGDLTQYETTECLRIDEAGVECIRERFQSLLGSQDVSNEYALGIFRNACRLTLLALKKIAPPRCVVLVPVYVSDNVIGGIAFVGPKIKHLLAPELLTTLANIVLSGIRLREEPHRTSKALELMGVSILREDLIQVISHRLFDPLERMKTDLTHLSKSVLSPTEESSYSREQLSNALVVLQEDVERLSGIATDILRVFGSENLETIADKVLKTKKTSISISEFFRMLEFANRNAFKKNNISLHIPKDIPNAWRFRVDEAKLFEVLTNLLDNALDFARTNVQVDFHRVIEPPGFSISVTDDGKGVAEIIRPRLFDPGAFYTPPESIDKERHGYGLYIAKRFMKAHGGDLKLNSDYTGGAQFIVTIPDTIEH